ncbi:MAG TPA: PD-(D/E)XK nuclease family protein [Tepidisphaeraceae bacterium]|jgi:hypothetical protein
MVPRWGDAALLRAVLSASGAARAPERRDTVPLLQRLLLAAPKVIRPQRKSTLFEAIHVLDLENPHSDFLAWLLDPLGPLTGNWLLKLILARLLPGRVLDDEPTVEREVPAGDGRLDLLISWSSFKLVIENKVWSTEGEQQVARYLLGVGISTPETGRIVYLSPSGRMPESVQVGDARVVALSYRDLAAMLDSGLQDRREPDPRGHVFAQEFRNCILRLLKVRYDMTKPTVSESTRIYLGEAKRIAEIKAQAIDEVADYLQWMYSEAKQRIECAIGSEVLVHRGKYVVIFGLPDWTNGDVVFGFYFGMDLDPTKRLMSEPGQGPWVGVGAWRTDDADSPKDCRPVVDLLVPALRRAWPNENDMREPDYSMALWREMSVPANGDIDAWADDVLKFLEKMASTLSPTLTQLAKSQRRQPGP